ncbi:hypothetical protein MM236_05380 [Belliella sp. DSM 107340]|uniref:Uncharacterized protein n=1 Tax=Belliella calami TaxID=2923436 RepID=A0ABS9ULG2_9BACT|nr:hypothetical protein [Belliella calami]MCH7397407.1 hypothetical protein [Belliella calami]
MKRNVILLMVSFFCFSNPKFEVAAVVAGTIVNCPGGDKYICYIKDGLEVRKGRGRTEVIINP